VQRWGRPRIAGRDLHDREEFELAFVPTRCAEYDDRAVEFLVGLRLDE